MMTADIVMYREPSFFRGEEPLRCIFIRIGHAFSVESIVTAAVACLITSLFFSKAN